MRNYTTSLQQQSSRENHKEYQHHQNDDIMMQARLLTSSHCSDVETVLVDDSKSRGRSRFFRRSNNRRNHHRSRRRNTTRSPPRAEVLTHETRGTSKELGFETFLSSSEWVSFGLSQMSSDDPSFGDDNSNNNNNQDTTTTTTTPTNFFSTTDPSTSAVLSNKTSSDHHGYHRQQHTHHQNFNNTTTITTDPSWSSRMNYTKLHNNDSPHRLHNNNRILQNRFYQPYSYDRVDDMSIANDDDWMMSSTSTGYCGASNFFEVGNHHRRHHDNSNHHYYGQHQHHGVQQHNNRDIEHEWMKSIGGGSSRSNHQQQHATVVVKQSPTVINNSMIKSWLEMGNEDEDDIDTTNFNNYYRQQVVDEAEDPAVADLNMISPLVNNKHPKIQRVGSYKNQSNSDCIYVGSRRLPKAEYAHHRVNVSGDNDKSVGVATTQAVVSSYGRAGISSTGSRTILREQRNPHNSQSGMRTLMMAGGHGAKTKLRASTVTINNNNNTINAFNHNNNKTKGGGAASNTLKTVQKANVNSSNSKDSRRKHQQQHHHRSSQSASNNKIMSSSSSSKNKSKKCPWRSAKCPKTGRTYYYNTTTRETQWRKPLELASDKERDEMERKERKQKEFFAAMEANILKTMATPGGIVAATTQEAVAEEEPVSKPINVPLSSSTPSTVATTPATSISSSEASPATGHVEYSITPKTSNSTGGPSVNVLKKKKSSVKKSAVPKPRGVIRTISTMDQNLLKNLTRVPSLDAKKKKAAMAAAAASKKKNEEKTVAASSSVGPTSNSIRGGTQQQQQQPLQPGVCDSYAWRQPQKEQSLSHEDIFVAPKKPGSSTIYNKHDSGDIDFTLSPDTVKKQTHQKHAAASAGLDESMSFEELQQSMGFDFEDLSQDEVYALRELAKATEEMTKQSFITKPQQENRDVEYDSDTDEIQFDINDMNISMDDYNNEKEAKEEQEEEVVKEVPPAMPTKGPKETPAKGAQLVKPNLTKRNTCGTLYVSNTMSAPDKDATIKCVCGVYRAHILQTAKEEVDTLMTMGPTSYISNSGQYFIFNDFQNKRTTTVSHALHGTVPEDKSGLQMDYDEASSINSDSIIEKSVPSLDDISKFYRDVFTRAQMETDCIIMSLIYIERLIKDTNGLLRPSIDNWRSILFSCMVLSSKVWDDLSMWNADFTKTCPAGMTFSLERINELEIAILNALKFNVRVPSSEYAKYYFLTRSMIIKSGLGGDDLLKQNTFMASSPLDIEGAKKLEQVSSNFQVQFQQKAKLLPRKTKSLDETSRVRYQQSLNKNDSNTATTRGVAGSNGKSNGEAALTSSDKVQLEHLVNM